MSKTASKLWSPRDTNRLYSAGKVEIRLGGKVVYETPNLLTQILKNAVASSYLGGEADAYAGWLDPPTKIQLGHGTFAENDSPESTGSLVLGDSSQVRLAQGFIGPLTVTTVAKGSLWMKRLGTSPGRVRIEIWTDSGGFPDTLLAGGESEWKAVDSLDTSLAWATFNFTALPSLTPSVAYHLLLRSDPNYHYVGASVEVNWGIDQVSPSFADGAASRWNATTWSAVSPDSDFVFRLVAQPNVLFDTVFGETDQRTCDSISYTGNVVSYVAEFAAGDAVGHHGHIGLLNPANDLFAIAVIDVEKPNTQGLTATWTITV